MNGILLGVWLTACAGDAASTHIALQHGARELFLTQNSATNSTIIGGQALAWAVGERRLRATRPKLTTGLTIALTVVRAWAVYHNVGIIRGMR